MDYNRWRDIEMGQAELTDDDKREGWHFCREFDGMLIGPGMPEMDACLCFRPSAGKEE